MEYSAQTKKKAESSKQSVVVPGVQKSEIFEIESIGEQSGFPAYLQRSAFSASPPPIQRMCAVREEEEAVQPGVVQAKLTIGVPNDPYEKEADQVADKVMRKQIDSTSIPIQPMLLSKVQRQMSSCIPSPNSGSSYLHKKLTNPGNGTPLSLSIRRQIEPVLGSDLSSVQVHNDSSSQQAADSINARAFTHQNHIYLGSGQSHSDVRLMAHEATHTVQQSSALQRNATNQSISSGYAAGLDDGELMNEIQLVEEIVGDNSNVTDTDESLSSNLQILRTEYYARDPGANTVGFQEEPSEPGNSVYSGLIPEGGEVINKVGIVAWDGNSKLRLRSSPDTSVDNIVAHLGFSTRLQIIKRFSGNWYFVSTPDGYLGYTAATYIFMDLPEPNARLHRVESGVSGTAIGIAEKYYGEYSDDWGQDLRFYVNVLAWTNNIKVPNTTRGWRSVNFQAGQLIWVPSQQFAYSLKGMINSGSYSYNIADFLGIADFIERVGQLWADFRQAVNLSGKYMHESITTQLTESMWAMAEGLAYLLLGAVAIIAISTAVGAAIGALAGGAGAAPGAVAGFEVGMVIIEWLGLAMLLYWIAESMVLLGSAFGSFLSTVWDARGNQDILDQAAREFADAIGLLIAKIFEALLMFMMAKGLPKGLKMIRGTRLGRALGESRAARWLTERSKAIESGESLLPGPKQTIGKLLGTGRPGAEPAPVTRVGQTQHFHNLPPERLPANLPDGHFWMRNTQGEWVLMREAGMPEVTFDLTVYSDSAGNANYVLRTGNRTIQTDALTRQNGTYARGQQRLPNEIDATGTNNPYRDPVTGEVWDKGHGIDYADTLEGPGVRSSTTDVVNFLPQQSWWNRGPRNTLVGRIRRGHASSGRTGGGGYREMAIYADNPPVTANGTPIPREFVFVETNRAGVAQRAWRIPNQAGAGTRSFSSINQYSVNLSEVPAVMLRTNMPLQSGGTSVVYTPFVIFGERGDDENESGGSELQFDEPNNMCFDSDLTISIDDPANECVE